MLHGAHLLWFRFRGVTPSSLCWESDGLMGALLSSGLIVVECAVGGGAWSQEAGRWGVTWKGTSLSLAPPPLCFLAAVHEKPFLCPDPPTASFPPWSYPTMACDHQAK